MSFKQINKLPSEDIQNHRLKLDQEKAIFKQRLKRMFSFFFSSVIFWLLIGYILGSAHSVYILTDALNTIDKLLVCK